MDWEQIDKQMAKETAKKGLMDKILALPMATRVIAAVVCLGILAGAYVLIAKSLDNDNGIEAAELSDKEIAEMEELDVLSLLDLSESEILATFGEDEKMENDSYRHYGYNFVSGDGKHHQYISVTFGEDIYGSESPISIACSGNIISIYGINTDTDADEVREILESGGLHFNGTEKSTYDGIEYVSEFYYTRDRADVQICVTYSEGGINNVDIYKMWDYGPNGEILPAAGYFGEEDIVIDEPVIDEEPAVDEEYVIEDAPVIEEEPIVEVKPKEPVMTNDEAHRILLDGYVVAGASRYEFADLTGDGIDEMINMGIDMEDGIIQVFMVQGDKAVKVMEKYNGPMNGYMVEYYLYTENGRNYILEYNSFMREGRGEIYYKIYSYNDAGNEVILFQNSYSGDMLSAEGESASDTVYSEFVGYKSNSRQLL